MDQTGVYYKSRYAIGAVAFTTLIMGYSTLFSVLPILVFYALWLPFMVYKGNFRLYPSGALILALALPLFCCFSFFWSAYPGQTLYSAVQYLSMIVCTLLIARLVHKDDFVKGVAIGTSVVLLITFASQRYTSGGFEGAGALVGYFGSKNQVGLFATIAILSGITVFFLKDRLWIRLGYMAVSVLIGILCLYLSQSMSSVLSIFLTVGAVSALTVVTKLAHLGNRLIVFVWCILAFITLVIFVLALDLDIMGKILGAVGKSSTLTGRTYLWSEGMEAALEKPFLGHGYAAFWVPGQPLAERYWEEFYITGKNGFHFHSLPVEVFVEIGLVGLGLFAVYLFGCFYKSLANALVKPGDPITMFILAISFMMIIRAIVEVDWLGPFGIGVLLIFWMFMTLFDTYKPDADKAKHYNLLGFQKAG